MVIKAIFFDLDDTLHDHLFPLSNALKETLPSYYGQVDAVVLYKQFRHFSDILWKSYNADELTLEELRINRIMLALESLQMTITREQAGEFQSRYEHHLAHLQLFPEVPVLLETLTNDGFIVGVITNGPVEHQYKKLKSLGITTYFHRDLIFISDEVGIAKPNPQLFEQVARKTGFAPNEHLYIGDTWENDIAAPSNAGWQSIWFNHRNRVSETNHKPLAVINKLSSVLEVVKKIEETKGRF